MDKAMTDIFQAVWDQARRSNDKDMLTDATALILAVEARKDEIDLVKAERAEWRKSLRRNDTNGTITTFDIHPLEYAACKILCPDLSHADWQAKQRAWKWVLKQPWAQEFRASPFEKTRF